MAEVTLAKIKTFDLGVWIPSETNIKEGNFDKKIAWVDGNSCDGIEMCSEEQMQELISQLEKASRMLGWEPRPPLVG